MDEHDWLAAQFEAQRPHLRAVAYRMLGSLPEAEDAVQEGWLHFSRADTIGIENLRGWLTTVVAQICLDILRSRKSRREEPAGLVRPEGSGEGQDRIDPEEEALLADSIGQALLIVLDTLSPAERLAFVLHDLFDVPFNEVAPIVGRSEAATRKLASHARRRVREAAKGKEAIIQETEKWSTPSSMPRARGTSTRCSRCWTRMWSCGPTAPPCLWVRQAKSAGQEPWPGRSPGALEGCNRRW